MTYLFYFFDTKFVETYFRPEVLQSEAHDDEQELAALLASRLAGKRKAIDRPKSEESVSLWRKNRT